MKAIISNRVYLQGTPELINKIQNELTYKIETKVAKAGAKAKINIEIIRNYKMLPKGVISFPRGRTDLIPDDYEIVDKTVELPVSFPEPKFSLREGQLDVYNKATGSCFINALVGWGSLKVLPSL